MEKFNVKLPEQFDSFEDFVSFMEPVVSKVEQSIDSKVRKKYYYLYRFELIFYRRRAHHKINRNPKRELK